MITALKIKKVFNTSLEVAIKYYGIISLLNNLELTPLEIKILAYTAVNGNIGGRGKDLFLQNFKTTKASISKSISALYAKGFLIKEYSKTKINSQLLLDFETQLVIQLNLEHVNKG